MCTIDDLVTLLLNTLEMNGTYKGLRVELTEVMPVEIKAKLNIYKCRNVISYKFSDFWERHSLLETKDSLSFMTCYIISHVLVTTYGVLIGE